MPADVPGGGGKPVQPLALKQRTAYWKKGIQMKVILSQRGIEHIRTEGLVMPVDGTLCLIGGAAVKALRLSFPIEERLEMLGYIEDDLKALCPIPQGSARILPLDQYEISWKYLVVIACQPHHVNDQIVSRETYCGLLTGALTSALAGCVNQGIKSVALTLISTGYRISEEESMRSIVIAFSNSRRLSLEVYWSFLQEEMVHTAQELCNKFGVHYQI